MFESARERSPKRVWAPDAAHGFVLSRIVDIGADAATVQPLHGHAAPLLVPYDCVFAAEEDERRDVDDNCALMYLNEATLLHNVKLRYARDQIYTYVANILIAINPYKELQRLYDGATLSSYVGKSLGVLPPHTFAIADKAYRDMRRHKLSQSVVVSGESGAGKTETQKHVLRFLCESYGADAGLIEKRILDTNPILEAFGNAKTLRNNNSSRFGKFVEIHFSAAGRVSGGFVSHYLLEKSRICRQQRGERNYHIFYQMCAGLDEQLRVQLCVGRPEEFEYLRHGCSQYFASSSNERLLNDSSGGEPKAGGDGGCLRDSLVDDVADWRRLHAALAEIGLSDDERVQVYATVAAVLQLGNVDFDEEVDDSRGGCVVAAASERRLAAAARLLGVDAVDLRVGLASRVMQPSKGGVKGTIIRVPLKSAEARSARDALAKAVYSRLFDFIVSRINDCIPFNDSSAYIGVLDIAGFEFFTVNGFEQFAINFCNEKLQHFFNDCILKQEQDLYAAEGLCVKRIEYMDNQDCIELIECKRIGIFDLLDEESKLPRPNYQHFTASVYEKHRQHFRLAAPMKSKLREHREVGERDGFLIRHFAGAVCYHTALFVEKNNDALHASLQFLVEDSQSPLVRRLFSAATASPSAAGKLAFVSVGSKFRSQLRVLLEKLRSTGTHFIRCIKPNSDMVAAQFTGSEILSQLVCSGMTSVLKLMQQGFPSRTHFADLYEMYRHQLPTQLARLDPRLFCKCLFKALGLNEHDYKFGLTKVFFRPGKFAEFDELLRCDPTHMAALVAKVQQWLIRMRWKKAQWGALSVIKLSRKIEYRRRRLIVAQSVVRGWLARRRYRPLYQGVGKLRALKAQLSQMAEMAESLDDGHRRRWQDEIDSAAQSLEQSVAAIRNGRLAGTELSLRYEQLLRVTERNLLQLRKQCARDQSDRLKRVEAQVAAQKAEAEKQEAQREQTERDLEGKRELERQRKADEKDYAEKELLAAQQAKILEDIKQREEQRAQERRDYELALRLAKETGGVADVPTPPVAATAATKATNDLSTWRYPDLRDVINTSNDVQLLEACRAEFHRRLRVFNDWKKQQKGDGGARLHDELTATPTGVAAASLQRYFKVPFARPSDHYRGVEGGFWYAHFDGRFVARQLEARPGKPAVLLITGRDDADMCVLPIEQTGLTRKRGAEILAHDFEQQWRDCGGKPYVQHAAADRL